MDVCWPPAVNKVSERLSARLDRSEGVIAFSISQCAPAAAKIRVDGRQIAVVDMAVAATSIGLPEFDQCVRHASPILIQNMPMYDGSFTDGLTILGVVQDQVVIEGADVIGAEDGTSHLREGVLQGPEWNARRPQHACLVLWCESWRMYAAIALGELAFRIHGFLLVRPCSFSAIMFDSHVHAPGTSDSRNGWVRRQSRLRRKTDR